MVNMSSPSAQIHELPPAISAALAAAVRGKPVDLSKRDLRRVDLSGRQLAQAKFVGADLTGANLTRALLHDADLFGANLTNVDLRWADLTRATVRGASLRGANLSHAILVDVDFRGGVMMAVDGTTPIGRSTTDISDCLADYTTATRARMSGVDLRGSSFVGANLEGANLFGADLSRVNMAFANLKGAELSEARLGQAQFSGANLEGARLKNAIGEDIGFHGARLEGAIFDGLDAGRCTFSNELPVLAPAMFSPDIAAALDAHEEWLTSGGRGGRRGVIENTNLSYIDLAGRNLSGLKIVNTKLVGAKLTRASLVIADLSGCDLMAADLTDAVLVGARLDQCNLGRANLAGAAVGPIEIRDAGGKPTGRRQTTSFVNADLRGANLQSVPLAQCATDGAKRD